MGLLPDHSAEFVLMREDDGDGGGLGMLDESSSSAWELDMVGVREIKWLEMPSVGMESALDWVYAV